MKTLTQTIAEIDNIKGVTLEERARLVLATLGEKPGQQNSNNVINIKFSQKG